MNDDNRLGKNPARRELQGAGAKGIAKAGCSFHALQAIQQQRAQRARRCLINCATSKDKRKRKRKEKQAQSARITLEGIIIRVTS